MKNEIEISLYGFTLSFDKDTATHLEKAALKAAAISYINVMYANCPMVDKHIYRDLHEQILKLTK